MELITNKFSFSRILRDKGMIIDNIVRVTDRQRMREHTYTNIKSNVKVEIHVRSSIKKKKNDTCKAFPYLFIGL